MPTIEVDQRPTFHASLSAESRSSRCRLPIGISATRALRPSSPAAMSAPSPSLIRKSSHGSAPSIGIGGVRLRAFSSLRRGSGGAGGGPGCNTTMFSSAEFRELLDSESYIHLDRLREAARHGVPFELRGHVWKYLIGVSKADKCTF